MYWLHDFLYNDFERLDFEMTRSCASVLIALMILGASNFPQTLPSAASVKQLFPSHRAIAQARPITFQFQPSQRHLELRAQGKHPYAHLPEIEQHHGVSLGTMEKQPGALLLRARGKTLLETQKGKKVKKILNWMEISGLVSLENGLYLAVSDGKNPNDPSHKRLMVVNPEKQTFTEIKWPAKADIPVPVDLEAITALGRNRYMVLAASGHTFIFKLHHDHTGYWIEPERGPTALPVPEPDLNLHFQGWNYPLYSAKKQELLKKTGTTPNYEGLYIWNHQLTVFSERGGQEKSGTLYISPWDPKTEQIQWPQLIIPVETKPEAPGLKGLGGDPIDTRDISDLIVKECAENRETPAYTYGMIEMISTTDGESQETFAANHFQLGILMLGLDSKAQTVFAFIRQPKLLAQYDNKVEGLTVDGVTASDDEGNTTVRIPAQTPEFALPVLSEEALRDTLLWDNPHLTPEQREAFLERYLADINPSKHNVPLQCKPFE